MISTKNREANTIIKIDFHKKEEIIFTNLVSYVIKLRLNQNKDNGAIQLMINRNSLKYKKSGKKVDLRIPFDA
jgi:hypothetical protein